MVSRKNRRAYFLNISFFQFSLQTNLKKVALCAISKIFFCLKMQICSLELNMEMPSTAAIGGKISSSATENDELTQRLAALRQN